MGKGLKKLIIATIVITMLLGTVALMGGCYVTENDFEFTISVDRNEVVQGESFVLTATLKNISSRTIRYWSSLLGPIRWYIEGWDAPREMGMSGVWTRDLRSGEELEKRFTIETSWCVCCRENREDFIQYQSPGEYVLIATVRLSRNRNSSNWIRVSSCAIKITVLEK